MSFSRALDIALSIVTVLGLVLLVSVKGDALYTGMWYYTVIPLVVIGLCVLFNPKPYFVFGVSLCLIATYVVYLTINWRSERPEGLLALGHFFSLPGAVIAVLIISAFLRHRSGITPALGFAFGAGGLLVGFCINQLVVCNTVMWCGQFSPWLK